MANVSSSNSHKEYTPDLRFATDTANWQEVLFSNLFEMMSNNTLSRAELDTTGTIKNIHYGDVLIKFGDTLNIQNDDLPYIKDNSKIRNPKYLANGDVIIADTAEDETVGKSTEIYGIIDEKVVSGLHTIPVRPLQKFASKYLGYYINSPAYHNQLLAIMQGIKVYSISKSNIANTVIKFPNIQTQSKIAELLCILDRRIEKQHKLIDSIKSYKRGLLSLVFGNKFPNSILAEILQKGKAGGTPQSSNSTYYNGNIPFLSISDITEQGKYICYTEKHISEIGLQNSTAWIVPQGSLILSMYASYGLVAINKVPLATSQAMFNMVFNKDVNVEYIYYYLSYLATTDYYTKMVSTGTQPNLNAEKVKAIPIYLPSTVEQCYIVKLLQSYDNKLTKEELILTKLLSQKTALLQQLFI